MNTVFQPVDRKWRGIGTIPLSGLGLRPEFDDFDAETFHYGDEDGLPGYSSVYVIIYSKDPKSAVKNINDQIISEIIK